MMKKTFFLLMSVVGTAMAQETSAIIPDSKDYHFVDGMGTSGHGQSPELSIMKKLLEHVHREEEIFRDNLSGWFIGSDNHAEDEVRGNTDAKGDAVKIEPHYNDEVIVLGLKLPEQAQSFTLSFSFDTRFKDNDKIGWTVWDYHLNSANPYGEVGEVHVHATENSMSQSPSGSITLTFGGGANDPLTGQYVFIMWNTQTSEDYLQINNIKASYQNTAGETVTYHTIPEPATATLSLLALAGLVTRPRRR